MRLPGKVAEALPVVRFRLKKLLPFEVEDAVVSYQMMSSAKGLVTVLAVAMPREVLAEYEAVVTAAGYVPGAVLPSTLAALAGLGVENGPGEGPASAVLVVNAGAGQVTTAIVTERGSAAAQDFGPGAIRGDDSEGTERVDERRRTRRAADSYAASG